MPYYCEIADCDTRSTFGLEWNKATHCKKHGQSLGMGDVKNKRCQIADCNKLPSFGLNKATHCATHGKAIGLKNIRSKRCQIPDCDIQANFGLEWKKATHCKKHGQPLEMKDAKNNCCEIDNCDTRATFGLKPKKATHCATHGGLFGMVDVVHKRCQVSECDTRPTFGLEWQKATRCKNHILEGMTNVIDKRCQVAECDKQPTFGFNPKQATHCATHGVLLGMIDVIHKLCATCESTITNPKYKPNCSACHFFLKPDDPRIRNYKTKEQAFMSPLQSKYPEMILDRVVVGGCSKRRPDGLLDCLTHSVIIEIDEDQHVGYESICDNKRTMELFQDLGSRPIVFIRLNPDSYKLAEKRIKGVFSVSKDGVMSQNKKEFARRYDCLLEAVEFAIANVPTKTVSSVKLYYSE